MERLTDDLRGWGFLRSVPRKRLLATVSYGVFRILAATGWPYLLYRYLKAGALPDAPVLAWGVLVIVLLFVASGAATYRQSVVNIQLLHTFSRDLTQRIWQKMNRLDWLTFHGKSRVYYFDMMMVEAWRLRSGMGALLEVLLVNSIIAGTLMVLIAFISLPLFLVCAGALAFLGGLNVYAMRQQRPFIQLFHTAWRKQHQWVSTSVDQFDLLKMGRGYAQSERQHNEQTEAFLQANARKLRAQSRWRMINQLASNVVRVGIFLLGIYWLQVGYVQLGELLLVLLLVSMVQSNLMQVPGAVVHVMEGQDAADALAAFFDLKEDGVDEVADSGDQLIHQLAMTGMSYHYGGNAGIAELDLELRRGNIYLWQGRNGSGKSTAAHVLLGLLEPQQGQLLINGEPADWHALKALRPHFGFLNQDSPIFMGSVKANAVFGHPQPDEAWGGLTTSWLSALLPAGNQLADRRVGERGEGLSGGEVKRIALIRELLRRYDVLILDEPLNHLDEYAITTLKREMVQLKQHAIIIIISHQPGFETIADEIVSF